MPDNRGFLEFQLREKFAEVIEDLITNPKMPREATRTYSKVPDLIRGGGKAPVSLADCFIRTAIDIGFRPSDIDALMPEFLEIYRGV